jgi:cytochrome c-type biogenesis protein CcmE
MQYLVQFMQRLVKFMQYLVKLLHEGCEVVAPGVFKGNPTVLLAKHVHPACEHLLVLLLGWF